jgi:orotate phosphoribosyltransferase
VTALGARIWRKGDPRSIRLYFDAGLSATRRALSGRELDPDTFVSTEQLLSEARTLAWRLPSSIDCVVGIARSGLLPATLIATERHVPLYAVSPADGVHQVGSGYRLGSDGPQSPNHVALIDDTVASGGQMTRARALVAQAFPGARITTAAVIAHPRGSARVDLAGVVLRGGHYLEWNFFNSGHAERAGFDFDGVLCHNEHPHAPLYLPVRRPIPLIITGRSERHRESSQAFLDRHGVRCERMIMRPDSVAGDSQSIGRWKGQVYAQSSISLFVESESDQARLIAAIAHKPVLCIACRHVIRPIARGAKARVSKGCKSCQ